MINDTIRKFGYPSTLIHEYEHWLVLLRPAQVTLGALILACRSDAQAFSNLTPAAFTELSRVTHAIEATLKGCFSYQKINYLMLMMVDPHVHFHVVPRYESTVRFESTIFTDAGWPGPPSLGNVTEIDPDQFQSLVTHIRAAWPSGA